MTTADVLRQTALEAFTTNGYLGTSLQQIADLAGVSKASVLYHFESKEQLLGAAMSPALERLETIVAGLEVHRLSPSGRADFVPEFVDFLLAHRLEVHFFVNQAVALVDVPVLAHAQELIMRLSIFCQEASESPVDKMRIGIALAGSAYILAVGPDLANEPLDEPEVRDALVTVMLELLTPRGTAVPATSAVSA